MYRSSLLPQTLPQTPAHATRQSFIGYIDMCSPLPHANAIYTLSEAEASVGHKGCELQTLQTDNYH